jgi:acylphosphatase
MQPQGIGMTDSNFSRMTCFVSGRVQGVGFRFHTKHTSQRFQVFGTVENLTDGRVKIIAEGDLEEVARFLDAVEQSMTGNVSKAERFQSAATHEFDNFSVLW